MEPNLYPTILVKPDPKYSFKEYSRLCLFLLMNMNKSGGQKWECKYKLYNTCVFILCEIKFKICLLNETRISYITDLMLIDQMVISKNAKLTTNVNLQISIFK